MTRIPFELRIRERTIGIRTPVVCPIPGLVFVVWMLGCWD